ncbi:MAG: amidohydrolase family protein [Phycisphaerae bacterium]
MFKRFVVSLSYMCCLGLTAPSLAQNTRATPAYRQMKSYLDAIPAIDTHDHIWPFDRLRSNAEPGSNEEAMNLRALLQQSYYAWFNPLAPRPAGMSFDDWWSKARNNFDNGRATTFYRFLLPAFQDLYGVDFDRITDDQARELDRKIVENYRDPRWLYEVITERANIEVMVVDRYWAPLEMRSDYPFAVAVLNINSLIRGFHPSEYRDQHSDPYWYAKERGLKVDSLDDYVSVLDAMIADAKQRGLPCLKNTLAYSRTLEFRNVPKERAAKAFGRPRAELKPDEIRDFEDFVIWRICELAAKHDLPIQIHTGQARIQGSNPMLLVDLIEANPKTKFVLFHGGFPWIGETGVIVMRHTSHVWVDSVWLPTLSYTMAKRAFHEWLEVMPSDRIMWGADCGHAEGVYGATELTRRCIAEVLVEKVAAGDLTEDQARRIGRQILRDNALTLFPVLKQHLWKHKGKKMTPALAATGSHGNQ